MDMMSMVRGILAAQAGNTQTQVAATILKSNADAEKFAVLTLLGRQQASPSLANVGAGIGGNLRSVDRFASKTRNRRRHRSLTSGFSPPGSA